MATQDIQADIVFNEGTVGSTTMAQVGYGVGSIFTKVGALNLGNADSSDTEGTKYENMNGTLANAGHVTSEKVDDFQGGMQLQLGEGAGDQNRTVVAIKSLTSENLGRVSKAGYWEKGSAVYSERQFTMKDVFGGGLASLSVSPTLAISVIEQGISDVAELRAQIGAVQTNLLQTNSNNLAVTMENIQKTESGIRDADMADEMTEFTKNQVLQNAAMSMMSQANQSSQNVLQLLR
jgi:flagellin-like hook-associated protein FlgL